MTDNTNLNEAPEVFGSLEELAESLENSVDEQNAAQQPAEQPHPEMTVNSAKENGREVPEVSASVTTEVTEEAPLVAELPKPEEDEDDFEIPPLTPKMEEDELDDEDEDDTPLEDFIDGEAKKAKEEGNTVEVKNVVLKEMRKVYKQLNPKTERNKKVRDVLDNVKVDPNNIDIVKDVDIDHLALHSQLELLQVARPQPVFPVIALKSGYRAEMTALTNNEKIELRNLRGSTVDQVLKLLKFIHAKMRTTSVGRMSFDKFLRVTAEEDYETLLFGVFSATFPNATEFNMNCPHCGTRINLPLYPTQLIEVIDQERAGNYVQKVLEGYNRGEDFLKESLVNTKQRIVLPVSKTVVELATPTLQNMIDNLNLSDRISQKFSADLVTITKFISSIYVLDITAAAKGHVVYSSIGERTRYLDFLNNLAAKDLNAIRKAVSERARQYAITYRIPDFKCPSAACGKPITNVSVDLTELIFFGIAGELTA